MTAAVTVVVPTLGRSPLLEECLRALRAEVEGSGGEIVLVEQGAPVPEPLGALADRRLHRARPVGFTAAVNLGIGAADGHWIAVVNDDAVVAPGWLGALVAALEADPRAASAQGLNLCTGEPPRVDGFGLAWNRWLQAIQLGHGEPVPEGADAAVSEVFGVSATAALYRREALREVSLPGSAVFDPRLGTYYEDADLAARLRAAGYRALTVPAATVRHAGAMTTGAGVGRWRQVYGNRYLVVARVLGRGFWGVLPRMALRDLVDLLRAAGRGDLSRVGGIVAGWARALVRLPGFLRGGPPTLSRDALAPRSPAAHPAGAP